MQCPRVAACLLLYVTMEAEDLNVDILYVSRDMPAEEAGMIDETLTEHRIGVHRVDSYKKAIKELVRRRYGTAILFYFSRGDDFQFTETVRLMKEISPALSIIAITRGTPLEMERDLRKSGLYFHLTIPFERSEFVEVLSGAIRKDDQGRARGST